ncbi:MAG: 2OG-Fe dioxygenase family protein [Polaromonas sp.]
MSPGRTTALTAQQALSDVSARLRLGLDGVGYAHESGPDMCAALGIASDTWADFSAFWRGLTLDRFMADGGTYRLRRYGAFELQRPGPLRLLPHEAYEQPRDINPLNGGVRREFDPLEPGFAHHPVLEKFLTTLADVLDAVEHQPVRWNIRLHPYRIRADLSSEGLPTPEGLHRDGVDYIVTLMVHRHNIEGGETMVTNAERQPVWHRTLADPMELLVANDRRTLHAVTPIVAADPLQPACRDVLVIAFTKPPAHQESSYVQTV